jgi:hypothetical protein
LTQLELLGDPGWPRAAPVSASLGLTELVAAGLLRRGDVRFVERRRFAAAVDSERGGGARPAGAPAAGISPGAELSVLLTWIPLGPGEASLELRVSEMATGRVAETRRVSVPDDPDPVGLARAAVAAYLATLDAAIVDKIAQAANEGLRSSDVATPMRTQGVEPLGSSPDEFTRFIDDELKKWSTVVTTAGIRK